MIVESQESEDPWLRTYGNGLADITFSSTSQNLVNCKTRYDWAGENQRLISSMKDLEPILNVLCNYRAGFVLSNEEIAVLSQWLKESEKNKELFEDLGDWTRLYMGNIDGYPRENIQKRLIELEETGG